MSSPDPGTGPKKHVPFVPETMHMKEFTLRALLLGLVLTVVLERPMRISDCAPASRSRLPTRPR